MMKKIDGVSSRLEDSKDPEILQIKKEILKTSKGAKKLVEKLNAFIGNH